MFFLLQTLFYKLLMLATGMLLKILPQPKPTICCDPGSSLQLCGNMVQFGCKDGQLSLEPKLIFWS